MVSESGRFTINENICLSITDYHPESWNPVWTVGKIIQGLISFFTSNEETGPGQLSATNEERTKIAKESKDKIMRNEKFIELFECMKDNIGMNITDEENEDTSKAEENKERLDTNDIHIQTNLKHIRISPS